MNQKCANYKVAIEKAQKVLADNFLFNPPIVAEEIAKNYGLKVGYYIFLPERRNVSGFISNGEIIINDDGEWECPQCGNKDHAKMNVTRRTCGYLGENFWNVGKTKEIAQRTLHL